jgi:hypothetical protein
MIQALALMSLMLLVMAVAQGSEQMREVPASEILAKISKGQTASKEYKHRSNLLSDIDGSR